MFFLLCLNVYSQKQLFTIIASGGNSEIKHNGETNWQKISTGKKIFTGDTIKIFAKGYLGLAHSTLNTVELNEEGIYSADTLAAQIDLTSKTVTKKLVAFIIDEMAEKKKSTGEMRTLGAVVRLSREKIDVNLPSDVFLFDTTFTFSWYPNSSSEEYIFQLLNPSLKTIYMKETSDTVLNLDLQDLNLQETETYKWLVFDRENDKSASDTINFNVISKARKNSIKNDLYSLSLENNDDQELLSHLILAAYYKENHLYLEAIKEYKKIVEMQPNVDEFWEEYLQFLIDVGLKREALSEWERSSFALKRNQN
ncbi:MAG: hypothetical protein D8M61_09860 [Ignavibacteriae bacterium]|nr:hypothetical protein [Ignavibacteriota bacterium]